VKTPLDDSAPRRVLVIAYYFPPMGLSGVQRTLKFVKYLPQFGWQPTVLTVQPRGYLAKDDSLLEELAGKDVRIERTNAAGPGRFVSRGAVVKFPAEWVRRALSMASDTFFIPDNKIGWKRQAVSKALALAREQPFNLIFATAPPFTDFLIGRELKAKLGIPLVLDYRDPWVEYPFKFYPTPPHKWWNIHLERKALRASSHVVTTNRRVKELILRRHRFLTYNDIDIISQGFDPEDFLRAAALPVPARSHVMRFAYAGVFWEDRKPDYFLRALHEIFKENPRMRGRIEAVFVGHFRDENRRLVARLGLHDAVLARGYLPHSDCIRELTAADVLWMVVGDDVGSPGKTYEYIGARKPILACAPEGFLKTTVLAAGGMVVSPKDVPAIKKSILELYGRWERHMLTGPAEDVVKGYSRVFLTGELVKLFELLVDRS
jgi:glycosyltransferase involved in cell wall biosynthesis